MKALEKVVLVAFATTTCLQLLWVYDAATHNDILGLGYGGVLFLEAFSLLSSLGIVLVVVHNWHMQAQRLNRFQLGIGVCGLGSVISNIWFLLICFEIEGGMRPLLIYGGLILWTVGLALIMQWFMSPISQRRKEIA